MHNSGLELRRWGLAGAIVAATTLVGTAAVAQEASASASVSTSMPTTAAAGDSDHAKFAGSFGVGYFGVRSVPMALNPAVLEQGGIIQMTADPGAVDAPVIGVRYWFNEGMGVDFGLGIRKYSGKAKWTLFERDLANPTNAPQEFTFEQNDVSQTGILIHAGLPIALNAEKHYVFELVPEANIGFSSGTMKDEVLTPPSVTPPPIARDDIKLSGFSLDIGARVGSEVHFGFIGVPNLALQASVGLFFSMQKVKADGGSRAPQDPVNPVDAQPKTTFEASSTTIGTTVHDTPWAIFTNSISALYYF